MRKLISHCLSIFLSSLLSPTLSIQITSLHLCPTHFPTLFSISLSRLLAFFLIPTLSLSLNLINSFPNLSPPLPLLVSPTLPIHLLTCDHSFNSVQPNRLVSPELFQANVITLEIYSDQSCWPPVAKWLLSPTHPFTQNQLYPFHYFSSISLIFFLLTAPIFLFFRSVSPALFLHFYRLTQHYLSTLLLSMVIKPWWGLNLDLFVSLIQTTINDFFTAIPYLIWFCFTYFFSEKILHISSCLFSSSKKINQLTDQPQLFPGKNVSGYMKSLQKKWFQIFIRPKIRHWLSQYSVL